VRLSGPSLSASRFAIKRPKVSFPEPPTAAAPRLRQEVRHPALDWDRVVKHACQNDIGPLVQAASAIPPAEGSAQGPLAALKALYCATAIRNTLLYRELEALLRALRTLGAPVIALKGAALADTVYQDRALRPMSDVDLMVRKEQLLDVEDLSEGWATR
jgi:Uncharacterised nucleotidyltransferase